MLYESAAQELMPCINGITVAQKIIDAYNIEGEAPPVRISDGAEGLVYTLDTTEGRFVAKIYCNGRTPNHVANEAVLFEYLNAEGFGYDFSTPRIIPTRDGQASTTIVTPSGDKPMLLMERSDGRPLSPVGTSQDELFRVGKALANMHIALDKYETRTDDKLSIPNARWYRNWGVKRHIRKIIGKPTKYDVTLTELGFFPVLTRSPNVDQFSQSELEEMQRVDQLLEDMLGDMTPPNQMDTSLIHNDLKPKHVLLSDHSVCFIDWGGRQIGSITQELGIFFMHIWSDENSTFERWQEIVSVILDGYCSVHELEEYEFAVIYDHIVRRCVDSIKYFCNLAIQSGCDVATDQITRRFQLVKQLIEGEEEAT